jgi:hypothetical protein
MGQEKQIKLHMFYIKDEPIETAEALEKER